VAVLPGIPGSVEFVEGNGGLPTVMLKHSSGASAQVRSSSSSSSSSSETAATTDGMVRHATVLQQTC
jgi:hypothetical protein